MQRVIWWLILLTGVGVVAAILWNALRPAAPPEPVPVAPPAVTAPPKAETPPEPAIRHPVPPVTLDKPLPTLERSDSSLQRDLGEFTSATGWIFQGFIRRVVATVDNLPAQKVAQRLRPHQGVPGPFAVSGSEGQWQIASDNAKRYEAVVKLIEAVDVDKLKAFYFKYYPLFQQAYEELGYPKQHFNDRLIAVIDHLLEAPELKAPVALLRPKVLYLYADPEMEKRSAGQKILMRMGAENAVRVKAKLKAIRGAVAVGVEGAGKKP